MSLISCENVSISYEQQTVISNLSFDVSEGDFLCLIGENGAGKSTMLKGLLGLIKLNSGTIRFNNVKTKKEIGYLPQQSEIKKEFPASVYEIVMSGYSNKSFFPIYTKEQKEEANDNMKIFGIEKLLNESYSELSGGQKQRVLLARALCSGSKILVLDEPVANLDPKATQDLYSILKHINKTHKITVIMVTHDIENSLSCATHVLYMGENKSEYFTVNDYLKSDLYKNFI